MADEGRVNCLPPVLVPDDPPANLLKELVQVGKHGPVLRTGLCGGRLHLVALAQRIA
jgi:hypothetical protein